MRGWWCWLCERVDSYDKDTHLIRLICCMYAAHAINANAYKFVRVYNSVCSWFFFFFKFFLSSHNLTLARFVWINDEMLKLRWKYGWLLNILLQSDYIGWLIVLMKYKFSDCRHCALNIHCKCTVRKRSSRSMAKPGWRRIRENEKWLRELECQRTLN